ncbi:type VI secretion system Vgr family protein [Flavobacterium daemonense]|uniref:type VI secretion system Vgr family protein n=1 Tax=Flavobacterium daemonense TaxID=1393049 RepID=UPI001184E80B|nr:phage baseplate assembly protein V [Flavobacterium daemonense]KAF2336831.1 type IV secretion protein Rhs [Flavobacterium daemonense]
MGHFSDQIHITIGGFTQNIIYYDLKLSQKMVDHHYFSFVWQYTGKAVIKPEDQAKAMMRYNGSEVIFTFKSVTGIRLMSKGIITGLSSIDRNGSAVGLHVSGTSHSIVLNDMPKSRTFLERRMDDIVLDILYEGPTEFYQRDAIRATYRKEFNYMAQYNETSFDFLKRLAQRYGQWFYFDGMRMQFGQIKSSKTRLINGASLHSFKTQVNMASHKILLTGYDYGKASIIKNSSLRTSEGSRDSFASNVGFNQGSVAQPDLSAGAYTSNARNKDEIDEMVALQTAGSNANSVYYSGISYFPIGLGQIFKIEDQGTEYQLVCIESTHHSEVHGNYTCEFKAIPADVSAPHYTDTKAFARAETQPATIKDNNDPEGLGRVRIEFFWGNDGRTTDWIRMIQPHGGAGKGVYFIPEIGEEVLVGFEGANVQCPYVMGTHYNGKESSGYATEKNDMKVIQTRSGNRIISNDATGDVTIESKKGQTIAVIHGDGNIRFKAPKNIELEAGEDIIMNAGRDIKADAKENIEIEAGNNIFQEAAHDIFISANGDIMEKSDHRIEIAEKDFSRTSDTSNEIATEASLYSHQENMTIQSGKQVIINSAENSNLF